MVERFPRTLSAGLHFKSVVLVRNKFKLTKAKGDLSYGNPRARPRDLSRAAFDPHLC